MCIRDRVTIVLRASQTGMLVFWVSLMACAEKGLAIVAVVASLIVYFGLAWEGATRGDHGNVTEEIKKAVTICGLLGDMSNCFMKRAIFWNAMPLLIAGAIATTFYTVEHVDNNYANSSAPVGPPGSPQHYDCRERTSGIYPVSYTHLTLPTICSV